MGGRRRTTWRARLVALSAAVTLAVSGLSVVSVANARAAVSVTTSSLPAARATAAYSATLHASGGVRPYRWSVASGSLPAGLALSTGGVLSGTPRSPVSASIKFRVADAARPSASATRTLTLGVLAGNDQSIVYVLDRNGAKVAEFAPGATGRAAPVATIEGAVTGLEDLPSAIAVTPSRRVYVTTVGSILVFAPDASGDAQPEAKISGSNTGLNAPSGLAADGGGRIWVAELASSTVSEFAANANGNVAPIGTIQGARLGFPIRRD